MRRNRSQLPVSFAVVIALVLMGRSGAFASAVERLAAWGWNTEPKIEDFPFSAPKLPDINLRDWQVTIPPAVTTSTTVDVEAPPSSTAPVVTVPAEALIPLETLDETASGLPVITSPEDRAVAVTIISAVRTSGRGPKTGYSRDRFGPAWSDNHDRVWGGNGCDTRNDILARDLDAETFRAGTKDCVVLTGTYLEPYRGETAEFSKDRAADHQVDHLVPLSYAWQMGAARWDDDTRRAFANDPLNLLLVEGSLNAQKGDSSPASWLPPNKQVRCAYVTRFAAVTLRYDLPVTDADKEAMLRQCT